MPATSWSARPVSISVGSSAAGASCAASSLAARVWSTRPKALKRKIRARAARPIHCPYRMSRSPPSGGDQMRDDGRRVGDVEPRSYPFFVERPLGRLSLANHRVNLRDVSTWELHE